MILFICLLFAFACVYTHLLASMEVRGQGLEVFLSYCRLWGTQCLAQKEGLSAAELPSGPLLLVSIQIPMWIYKKIKLGAHSRSSLRAPCYMGSIEIHMPYGVYWDLHAMWVYWDPHATWDLLRLPMLCGVYWDSPCYVGSIEILVLYGIYWDPHVIGDLLRSTRYMGSTEIYMLCGVYWDPHIIWGLLRSTCYVGSIEIPMLRGVYWDSHVTWGLLRATCYVVSIESYMCSMNSNWH